MKIKHTDELAEELYYLRRRGGLTRQIVAEIVGITPLHVFSIEAGTRGPSDKLLMRLATLYGDTAEEREAIARQLAFLFLQKKHPYVLMALVGKLLVNRGKHNESPGKAVTLPWRPWAPRDSDTESGGSS